MAQTFTRLAKADKPIMKYDNESIQVDERKVIEAIMRSKRVKKENGSEFIPTLNSFGNKYIICCLSFVQPHQSQQALNLPIVILPATQES